MTYGRGVIGRSLYGGSTLVVSEEIYLTSSVVSEVFAVGSLDELVPLTGGTGIAEATTTPGELSAGVVLEGTATMTMSFTASMELLVPPSDPPDTLTATQLQRVSPIMPVPTLVDGRPT